jgi:hypothetical protein
MKGQNPSAPLSLQDFIQKQLADLVDPNAARNAAINELFSNIINKEGIQGLAYLANCLFFAIARHYGEAAARHIFKTSGPMPKELRTALRKAALLDRVDRMDRINMRNIAQLARDVAEENKALPRDQQRGAGGTDPRALEDFIRDLLETRKEQT